MARRDEVLVTTDWVAEHAGRPAIRLVERATRTSPPSTMNVGVTPDTDVIAYCRIGGRSSHSWFVLHELLGSERVRNSDGSWTEYGSLVGMPVER